MWGHDCGFVKLWISVSRITQGGTEHRVCVFFPLDWSPGWSQNFGSAALHEGETTHLRARSEASKGGNSFFWGPRKSIDHSFPLGLFHSGWTPPSGRFGWSHPEIKASVQTGWTQTQVLAPEPAVLLQYPIKLQAKQQGTEGSRWQTDSKPGFTAYFTSVKCFLFRLLPEGACDKSFSTASPSKFIPTPYKSTDNLILTYPLHFKQERRSFQGFCAIAPFS